MRRLLVLTALLLPALAGAAQADTIAIVRDGGVKLLGGTGGVPAAAAKARVEGVAFDRGGGLLLSIASAGGESCDYMKGATLVRAQDIKPGGIGEGGCAIHADPRGGLLATFSAGTISSATTYRIDLDRKRAGFAGPGYSAAISPDGKRLVVVFHAYYPGGGSYETLVAGRPGVAGSFTRIVPATPQSADLRYESPSFAPDGKRIAAVLTSFTTSSFTSALLVGPVGGKLAAVWRSAKPGIELRGTSWSANGRSVYFVLAGENDAAGDLVRLRLGEKTPTVVARRVSAFAVAPS